MVPTADLGRLQWQNICLPMHQNGFNVLGTSPLMIDAAEDRYKFSQVVRAVPAAPG